VLLVAAVLMVLGCFRAASNELAWLGMGNWLPFFWGFWGFQVYLGTPAARRRVALALVAGTVPVILTGLGQLWWVWSGPFQWLGGLIIWHIKAGGNPPERLAGLFDTLRSAMGPGARVGLDDVHPHLGAGGGIPPWELTDAIERGDTARALETLHRVMGAGDRHPLQILATLHGHVVRIARLDGSGANDPDSAAAVLGLRPQQAFQARKALDTQRRWGSSSIGRAVGWLAAADVDLRGGTDWPPELVMEVLVARLSRLRR
jgi:hypothetical protein